MKRHIALGLATAMLVSACASPAPAPAPAPAPTTPPAAAQPTAAPPPMANKLILYGDLAWFRGKDQPENCVLKSRYAKGDPVGFRMTAIDPLTGKFADTAELVVNITYGGKTDNVKMRYRGTGDNPRPGFWTAKWVVPDDAPTGIVKYTVTAKDKEGRTGEFKPFDIEASLLTIVN